MEMRFTQTTRKYAGVFEALFLAAILCAILATIDMLHLIPFGIVGAVLPLIPQIKRKNIRYIILGMLVAFFLVRFTAVLDGGKLLANRMFALSEQSQAYEYDYFKTTGENAVETMLFLSMLAGFLCAMWGNRINVALAATWVIAMAYFGVTPDAFWLALAVLFGLLNFLPGQQRWFHGFVMGCLVIAITLTCTHLAPEPNKAISALDEGLRDALAMNAFVYEQVPIPTDVPEPEIVPPPKVEQEQPDHGVQQQLVNILFIVLASLTLILLFVPAIIKDRAAKRSEKNRAGLNDPDHSSAIRAMYLYAQRWRSLTTQKEAVPADVYAIWQEAAFSDHPMSPEQRETVHSYMVETAESAWKQADLKKRLFIQYRIAL